MAFGVLSEVGYRLPAAGVRADADHRAAHCGGHIGHGRTALARPDARCMALIGKRRVRVPGHSVPRPSGGERGCGCLTLTLPPQRNCSATWQPCPALCVVPTSFAAEAARGADIVTTITADKANATIVTPDMIEPGMHLNAVGGDCPGRPSCIPDALRRKDFCGNTSRKPASRATYSSCLPTTPSPSCGACWQARPPGASRPAT